VASHIATALSAGRLMLLTDVDGVLDAEDQLISSIDADATIGRMIVRWQHQWRYDPKDRKCPVYAIKNGVKKYPLSTASEAMRYCWNCLRIRGIGTEVTE
jgi:acetylglutamate kinase